ncbi:hypothetical protein M430DRAFT_32779 [Amorphotheca resinae ATCC 22711]|uniref:Uncharacterized protein n=1 Tax=Amorphotheca resinae ATCC 22711 TaxID=857342 RepID=A0A2T3BG45_AMORE|nr:hypothetical protein M430DRAFT_32779 [Amorphotheca resinae ATCC 22711]PSS28390.1 hypothetical protein M430DRAFT_32779 [Amorphotheca resinae ATCC 22711]
MVVQVGHNYCSLFRLYSSAGQRYLKIYTSNDPILQYQSIPLIPIQRTPNTKTHCVRKTPPLIPHPHPHPQPHGPPP